MAAIKEFQIQKVVAQQLKNLLIPQDVELPANTLTETLEVLDEEQKAAGVEGATVIPETVEYDLSVLAVYDNGSITAYPKVKNRVAYVWNDTEVAKEMLDEALASIVDITDVVTDTVKVTKAAVKKAVTAVETQKTTENNVEEVAADEKD